MTTRTKIIFFIIMGFALSAVVAILVLENFGGVTIPTRGDAPVDIEIAVAPSLEPWVQDAARIYHQRNPNITITITPLKGLEARNRLSGSNAEALPDAWLAEAAFVREMAERIPYADSGDSMAQTRLIWLATSRRQELAGNLDWSSVRALVDEDFQFTLALRSPTSDVEGLAVYISAAASLLNLTDLSGADVTSQTYLDTMAAVLEAVPQRNRSPLDQLNRTPPSVDVGILLESETNELDMTNFIAQPPQYNVIFDYPYYVRQNAIIENADARRQAAQQFGTFLRSLDQQQRLSTYGFVPAGDTTIGSGVQINGSTATRLWNRVR